MIITPIRTEQDYNAAMDRIDELWCSPAETPESDELKVLATLVEAYEAKHHSISPPDPIEAIKFRMEQQGLTKEDMVPFFGHRSRVSDVLNRRRKLKLGMIRSLSDGLKIPLESLISDYSLVARH
ncbi:transcriptional regulator [Oceanisphaera sp. IT1-181]|uniref:helix-turn-helix domain-containing protein n=1 Tax=Oceanisphaera sp. IT1-181 TaxID=3081199 RepID=UPI0029C9F226|nr:transcriptional regulator [Oceanisphaera sp. IT1-181]